MRAVVTGGGTGGHIYPALAVAQALSRQATVEAVVYLGKTNALESEIVPQNGIAFEGLEFYGMPRGKSPLLPFKLLTWFCKLQQAKAVAREKLRRIRPDVVFGTGGYVSAPVLMAAKDLGIPYAVHEPDAKPGLVNQLMSRSAALMTTSFAEGAAQLQRNPAQKVLVTGNPIREEIGTMNKQEALAALDLDWPAERPVLLVTGGSQGARRINQAVVEALPVLLDELGLAVVHLTGKKLYEQTQLELLAISPELQAHPFYRVWPYSAQMAALLALADVALCRAGSLSLSEMYVCGVPTILVPYPFAAADHQRKNAQASVRAGASLYVEDSELNGARLVAALQPLLVDAAAYEVMQASARALGHPHATVEIVNALMALAADRRC